MDALCYLYTRQHTFEFLEEKGKIPNFPAVWIENDLAFSKAKLNMNNLIISQETTNYGLSLIYVAFDLNLPKHKILNNLT